MEEIKKRVRERERGRERERERERETSIMRQSIFHRKIPLPYSKLRPGAHQGCR